MKKDKETAQNSLALLSHFAKGAREHLLGLPPAALPVLPIPAELLKDDSAAGAEAGLPEDVRQALAALRAEQAALDAELAERFMVPPEERTSLNKVWMVWMKLTLC